MLLAESRLDSGHNSLYRDAVSKFREYFLSRRPQSKLLHPGAEKRIVSNIHLFRDTVSELQKYKKYTLVQVLGVLQDLFKYIDIQNLLMVADRTRSFTF